MSSDVSFTPPGGNPFPQFYEADLRSQMLNQAFNTKPYNDFDPASFLVHFHGPKPHEYLAFLDSGQCEFFNVCEQGVLRYGRMDHVSTQVVQPAVCRYTLLYSMLLAAACVCCTAVSYSVATFGWRLSRLPEQAGTRAPHAARPPCSSHPARMRNLHNHMILKSAMQTSRFSRTDQGLSRL